MYSFSCFANPSPVQIQSGIRNQTPELFPLTPSFQHFLNCSQISKECLPSSAHSPLPTIPVLFHFLLTSPLSPLPYPTGLLAISWPGGFQETQPQRALPLGHGSKVLWEKRSASP